MFTGLVSDLGVVMAMRQTDDGVRLGVASDLSRLVALGDSVAVDGCCLTATEVTSGTFWADVMHESLRCTGLGRLAVGSRVNLELAMRGDDRFGGHVVQGHVDGVGQVSAVREDGFARVISIRAAPDLMRYLVHKGSVTVSGVSLTVSDLRDEGFDVSLIPETAQHTTLGTADVGDRLNLEVDLLAKYVERLVQR